MTELTITLPLPPRACHPNASGVGGHWSVRSKAKAKQREDAGYAALAALNRQTAPRWPAATCQATFWLARKTDGDNLIAWLKASLDGLQDAGIVADDAGLTHLPPLQVLNPRRGGERKVVLVVRGGE